MKLQPVKPNKFDAFPNGKQFNGVQPVKCPEGAISPKAKLFNMVNIKNFLFKNIGIRQTILKNTVWLTIAEIITRLLGLAAVIGIARILGASEYGKFAFALSFVSLFAVVGDLGISEISIRELSKGRWLEKEYPAIFSLKMTLAVVAVVLMLMGSFFVASDPIVQKAIWLLAFFIGLNQIFNNLIIILRSRQKMEYESLARSFQAIIVTGFVFFVLFTFPSVGNLSLIYLLSNLIVLSVFLIFFHFYIRPLKLDYNPTIWRKFLKNSWPLAFGLGLAWIYGYVDSIMLGHSGLIKETGWYNAALRIAIVIITPAILITKSFFPALSKLSFFSQELFKTGKKTVQQIWNHYMETIIVLAVPIMLGGWILAPQIIHLLYGADYQPAGFTFQLLIIVAGISFFYYPYGLILVVVNQQRKNFLLIVLGALINIILNLLLIKSFGFYGVAGATIISSAIVFILAIEFSRRFANISVFNLRLLKTSIISIFSSLVMLLIISQLLIHNFNVIFIIIIGALVYSVILFLFYNFFQRFRKV